MSVRWNNIHVSQLCPVFYWHEICVHWKSYSAYIGMMNIDIQVKLNCNLIFLEKCGSFPTKIWREFYCALNVDALPQDQMIRKLLLWLSSPFLGGIYKATKPNNEANTKAYEAMCPPKQLILLKGMWILKCYLNFVMRMSQNKGKKTAERVMSFMQGNGCIKIVRIYQKFLATGAWKRLLAKTL